jgi:hydrogenase maturation factor
LLAAVPAAAAAACLADLHCQGYAAAAIIGQVRDRSDAQYPLTLSLEI